MNLPQTMPPLPLVADLHGIIRVSGTRVPLATMLRLFRNGATPEEIVLQFDTLPLADVYAIIAAYLRDRVAFDEYLSQEDAADTAAWEQVHTKPDRVNLRDRLTARREARVPVSGG